MSQIDPWALPQGSGAPSDAGIPNSMPTTPLLRPVSKALPLATMVAAGLYSVACVVAIFVLNSRASLAQSISDEGGFAYSQDDLDRAHAADSHVSTVFVITVVLFIAMIVLWVIMQRRIKAALPDGAFPAVYKRAGGPAVRIVSVLSVVFVLLSQGTNSSDTTTLSQVASHDHMSMIYLSVRVLLGAVLAFYAYRLMRVTQEGIARINAAR